MTVSAWQIYLITRLDDFRTVLCLLLALSLAASIISAIFAFDLDNLDSTVALARKVFKSALPTALASLMLILLVPGSKETAVMLVVPKVLDSKLAQQDIPEAVRELCRQVLGKEKK